MLDTIDTTTHKKEESEGEQGRGKVAEAVEQSGSIGMVESTGKLGSTFKCGRNRAMTLSWQMKVDGAVREREGGRERGAKRPSPEIDTCFVDNFNKLA